MPIALKLNSLFIVGFEAVDRSKGRYRGDEEGGPTERRTCGLSRQYIVHSFSQYNNCHNNKFNKQIFTRLIVTVVLIIVRTKRNKA